MNAWLENRRKSYEKLDGVVVPVIVFAAGILAKVATEDGGVLQKISLALLVSAILVHYLSFESEAQVFKDKKPDTRANKLTGILNYVRGITLTLGLIFLIFGIIGA